ncbi:MAG TPA: hypothetical protein H9738_13555 [Candidatus Blautia pullistercoris]|uniref:Pesticidal crystal protein Cry22Aa Ig-like domain-containing protein n=1 Tax=Candidatus Blautia pullistercoris TaxID=2838499 RepID=A0A9D2APD8_9FIRM|nr:hypothetical protein [Candidatus Blautia pullistercoris]
MRFVRAAVIIIFILSLGIFGVSQVVELQNRDPHVPEITSDREILEIPCEYTQEQLTEGLTATDQEDGDLTGQIVAGSFSRFIEPGVCNLTYVVFDSANQPGTLTRQVRFTDYHSPRLTLTEPLTFQEGEGSYNEVMNRLGAVDQLDGDLSDWLTQTETDVNYQTAGTYTVTFEVSNSLGDTVSQALPVHVMGSDNHSLSIDLTGGIAYIQKGGVLNPEDFVEELRDSQGNSLDTGMIRSDSNVDLNTPGVYEIHYTADDGGGNTGETWLTVIVEE